MIERLGVIWDISPGAVELEKGVCRSRTDTELSMTFKELAEQLNGTGGPIVGRAVVSTTGVGVAFAGCVVDVEVDPETGKVDVLRFTMVQDAGKAIHPSYVEGQMQGGAVQGIGWALNEEYFMRRRRLDDELQPSRLSHAHQPGSADDRHGHRGGPHPRPSLRRPGCGRGVDRAASGGYR